ncbi:hypothetical protein Tco_0707525 [Tanacetum coccineum]|uniref:Uncharacterized protein n=1 Tax=Tanacetum coccineum TaxID=301880 RepID=A0ABQ4YAG0_9ASTR
MIPGSYVPTRLQLKVDLGLIEIENDVLPAETRLYQQKRQYYQQKRKFQGTTYHLPKNISLQTLSAYNFLVSMHCTRAARIGKDTHPFDQLEAGHTDDWQLKEPCVIPPPSPREIPYSTHPQPATDVWAVRRDVILRCDSLKFSSVISDVKSESIATTMICDARVSYIKDSIDTGTGA